MNALEWKLYQEWFAWLVDNYTTTPTGFIYLKTDPEVCYNRLVKRDRKEEASVSMEYLQSLHDKHEAWLIDKKKIATSLKSVPVLTLDANQEFEHDQQALHTFMDQVSNFIERPAYIPVQKCNVQVGL